MPVKRHKYSVFEAASSVVTPSTTKSSSGGGALGPDWHYRIATKGKCHDLHHQCRRLVCSHLHRISIVCTSCQILIHPPVGLKNSDEGKKVQVEYGTEILSLSGDRDKFRPEDFEEITIYNEEDEGSWNVYVG